MYIMKQQQQVDKVDRLQPMVTEYQTAVGYTNIDRDKQTDKTGHTDRQDRTNTLAAQGTPIQTGINPQTARGFLPSSLPLFVPFLRKYQSDFCVHCSQKNSTHLNSSAATYCVYSLLRPISADIRHFG